MKMFLEDKAKAVVLEFRGEYRFLSNFWPVPHGVRLPEDPNVYPSVEHGYVAAKMLTQSLRNLVLKIKHPGEAKRFGRLEEKPGFQEIKLSVMADLIRQKFAPSTELADRLLATGDAKLIEGNNWNDTFWGVCRGEGRNELGKMLMAQRRRLREGIANE